MVRAPIELVAGGLEFLLLFGAPFFSALVAARRVPASLTVVDVAVDVAVALPANVILAR